MRRRYKFGKFVTNSKCLPKLAGMAATRLETDVGMFACCVSTRERSSEMSCLRMGTRGCTEARAMRANGWAAGRGRGVACGTALPHTAARRRRDAPQGGVSERTAPAAPLSRRRRRGSARAGPATGPAAGDGATWPHGSRAAFAHVAVDTICRAHGRVYARATLRRVDGDAQRVAARGAGQDLRCMVSNSGYMLARPALGAKGKLHADGAEQGMAPPPGTPRAQAQRNAEHTKS